MDNLRSMLGRVGNQTARTAGVVPGVPPQQMPAVGGAGPMPMAAPQIQGAPPMEPMPMQPQTPVGGVGDMEAMSFEQIMAVLREMPPDDFLMLLQTIPDPAIQEQVLMIAAMVNPAIAEFLQSQMGGAGAGVEGPMPGMPVPGEGMAGPSPEAMTLSEQLRTPGPTV